MHQETEDNGTDNNENLQPAVARQIEDYSSGDDTAEAFESDEEFAANREQVCSYLKSLTLQEETRFECSRRHVEDIIFDSIKSGRNERYSERKH